MCGSFFLSLSERITSTSLTELSSLNYVLIHGGISHSTHELWPWIRILESKHPNCFTQCHYCHILTSVKTHLKKSSSPDSFKDVISQRIILRQRVSQSSLGKLFLHKTWKHTSKTYSLHRLKVSQLYSGSSQTRENTLWLNWFKTNINATDSILTLIINKIASHLLYYVE